MAKANADAPAALISFIVASADATALSLDLLDCCRRARRELAGHQLKPKRYAAERAMKCKNDQAIEEALGDLAGEFGVTRNEMIRCIFREWMEQNMYLPVHKPCCMDQIVGEKTLPEKFFMQRARTPDDRVRSSG